MSGYVKSNFQCNHHSSSQPAKAKMTTIRICGKSCANNNMLTYKSCTIEKNLVHLQGNVLEKTFRGKLQFNLGKPNHKRQIYSHPAIAYIYLCLTLNPMQVRQNVVG